LKKDAEVYKILRGESRVVEFVVAVAVVHSRLAVAFHLTCTLQSSIASKFEANFSCQTRRAFRSEGGLYVRRHLANPGSLLYQRKHVGRCERVATVQNDKNRKDEDSESFHWTEFFIPNSMKTDKKYTNVWLEEVPNLSVECSKTNISELLGERVKNGSEEFSIENTSLEVAASLLLPKKFGEDFPLKKSGSRFSRVFLREDLIWTWNALVDDENRHKLNILCAASGLGKSIYLYLIAIFARHFGIPVQYIGSAGTLLLDGCEHESIACKFAAMLLFMNSYLGQFMTVSLWEASL